MTASSALPSPRRRFAQFRRWTKRALLGIVVILLLVAIAGALYQYLEVRLWAKASPPGRLVLADGASMHIYCTGEGTPTVVLVSGLGDDWTTWGFVLHDVAAMTRVCAYDRAGLGWSAASPAARTSRNIAAELEATLNAAGEKGPYFLVGHSIGGLHIREYQAQHPDKVMDVVLRFFLSGADPSVSAGIAGDACRGTTSFGNPNVAQLHRRTTRLRFLHEPTTELPHSVSGRRTGYRKALL